MMAERAKLSRQFRSLISSVYTTNRSNRRSGDRTGEECLGRRRFSNRDPIREPSATAPIALLRSGIITARVAILSSIPRSVPRPKQPSSLSPRRMGCQLAKCLRMRLTH